MSGAIKNYLVFLYRCGRLTLSGDWRYYAWIGALFAVCLLGLNAYAKQFVHGLIVTDMTDQVSWGVYISNFTFLVGVAAAAVMLVIPVYIYKNEELHDLVIFGELLAVAAIIMCLAFVTVDLGRPDRFWHLIPLVGKFNFPGSMLSWDVIVLNGYLLLNVHICGYLIYCRYQNRRPAKWFYIPFVFVAIVWAVSIHTVTAFLYVGLGGRPFWNSSIVGPRFLASAFTAGPALIILALQVIRRVTTHPHAGDQAGDIGADLPVGATAAVGRGDLDLLSRKLPEFASVAPELREMLIEEGRIVSLPAGAELVHEGDRDRRAYFILSGSVAVLHDVQGKLQILEKHAAGEIIGEGSTLAGTPRTASIVVDEDARFLCVGPATLRKLMRDAGLYRFIRSRLKERLVITDRALLTLRSVVQVSMIINVFLLMNELFKEFYTDSLHVVSAKYLYFGLHGNSALVPWIWTAVLLNILAMILLVLPITRSLRWLNLACVLAIFGIWIEKGMGLVIPGFVPTPLGEIVEYSPTLNETLICFGIWAMGLLLYTFFLRMAVPVLEGKVTKANESVWLATAHKVQA